jgi:BsuBI/PstI restriction endonuclease domain/BsuBI/PstI restriction endonuclease HTH domain
MHKNIENALKILAILGLPRPQQNERSALSLLAILNLTPEKNWYQAENPLIGITPIMDWIRQHYQKDYAPNSRETIRRQTIHQFVSAGIALYNPDDPRRPVNSPKAVYQVESPTLDLLRSFETDDWEVKLKSYVSKRKSLSTRYARERDLNRIPIELLQQEKISLTPGSHSELIKAIIEEFGSRFVPGGILIYVGDTGNKWGYFDQETLAKLNVSIDSHGKMPDVVFFDPDKNWLILAEAVTSHGPVDGKRHDELKHLFADSSAGLVFVTAFPNRSLMARYLSEIAWETEVWSADAPSHLIHFNGVRFLGPYEN